MTNPPNPSGIDWNQILEDQANDAGFAALPEDTYTASVKSAMADKASTGSPMIKITFEVTTGPYATRLVWTNVVLKTDSPGAMRFAMRKLRALGIDVAWLASENPPLEQVASKIVGAEVQIKVTQRTFNDEVKNDVDTITALDSGVPDAPTPAAAPEPQIPTPTEPTMPKAPGDPF